MRKSTGIGPNMSKLTVIAFSHTALWMICSAVLLPSELQGPLDHSVLVEMRRHFCSTSEPGYLNFQHLMFWVFSETSWIPANLFLSKCSQIFFLFFRQLCDSQMYSERHLCRILCRQNDWYDCFNDTGSQLCGAPCTNPYCRYEDAVVCQYGECSCIYSIRASPFCGCRNDDVLATSVPGPGSQYTISNCTNANSTLVLSTPSTSIEETSAPVGLSTSSEFNIPQSTSLQPSKQSTTATSKHRPNGQVNVVAIALGAVLVSLVVIYLCRSGKLSGMLKKPSKQDDQSSSIEFGTQVSNRERLPEPLALGGVDEYSYAHDHLSGGPTTQGTGMDASVTHAYVNVQESALCAKGRPAVGLTAGVELSRSQNETPAYEEVSAAGTDVQDNAASNPYQQLNRATMESTTYQELKGKPNEHGLKLNENNTTDVFNFVEHHVKTRIAVINCTNANSSLVFSTPSTSIEETSAPVGLSTSSEFNIQQSTCLQPSKQSTTATSKQSTTATSKHNDGGQVTVVVPIAIGAVLLILVILVVIYLCRSGKLSAMLKKPSEHKDESRNAELGRKASNRAQLPEPLVINNLEYSYAYDHWPVRPPNATTVDPSPVTRAGALVDGQGSVRYVTGGPTTEAADVHPDFVLERRAGYEEVEIGNDEGSGSATEVAHSSPGQSLTEGDDHAYFQVFPTRESQRSHNKTPGYEEVSVTGTDVQENAASSPYQQLNGATMESSEYQGLKGKADDDLTGEENASSQYQHLNRAALKRFNEGDRQKGNDDYEHLKGQSDYDVPRPVGYKTTE
ncbi:uncharacterized protein LOC119726839 [Patiria miniata]|uniref:Uncharacterized protein n=1 Tax=Patiria miniata TaxID=46514 RepID=A0A913ZSL7_PATMI|nr:uncharacterized protein LOC119726839 [Patiria miniata]